MTSPYNKYAEFIRKTYKERVQKITVHGGFTCPNRDGTKGTGGCTYCNNEAFTPPKELIKLPILEQVQHGIRVNAKRYKAKKFFVYFQAYTNTYDDLTSLKTKYEQALGHPQVIGLSIGTRPDCVSLELLDYLEELNQKYEITLEYGIESIFDDTLTKINRCHTFKDTLLAIEQTKKRKIPICGHLILGFPWENKKMTIDTAKKISELKLDFLKLHQLHVLKNTQLEKEFLSQPFNILTEEEYTDLAINFLRHTARSTVIQRLFAESPSYLLAQKSSETPMSVLLYNLEQKMLKADVVQGDLLSD